MSLFDDIFGPTPKTPTAPAAKPVEETKRPLPPFQLPPFQLPPLQRVLVQFRDGTEERFEGPGLRYSMAGGWLYLSEVCGDAPGYLPPRRSLLFRNVVAVPTDTVRRVAPEKEKP